jgi:hypothetical protein
MNNQTNEEFRTSAKAFEKYTVHVVKKAYGKNWSWPDLT